MGGRDRNGDGDPIDNVVAAIEPVSGVVTNLGLAVSRLAFAGDVIAFDVPEVAQGNQDLDGDGSVGTSSVVPHFHDLSTGETWSSELRGARILSADERYVALAEDEAVVGDRNGDGDALDQVLAFYDLESRTVASAGLALRTFMGSISPPLPHQRRFGERVSEEAQGLGDLDGDGDATGYAVFVYDPAKASARILPGFHLLPVGGVRPFVLTEFSLGSLETWLYDADEDLLVPTGWTSAVVQSLGDQLVLLAIESQEGEDLDGDGTLDDDVTVLYDPASGTSRITGLAGQPESEGGQLVILASEKDVDWSGDGDFADGVLHVWDDAAGEMVNTGQTTHDVAAFGGDHALFLRSEAEAGLDLDGDGDLEDHVAHVWDTLRRRAANLGLASEFLLGIGATASRGFLPVSEAKSEIDLNGDGDLGDDVLHLVLPR